MHTDPIIKLHYIHLPFTLRKLKTIGQLDSDSLVLKLRATPSG